MTTKNWLLRLVMRLQMLLNTMINTLQPKLG
uniref:Oligopeptide ABC transporter n=1 Tax=Streptococcus pneumoniae TaxID=1313 RepID=G4XP88_STREE|nr:oligopeptide ABC transporter [Streptococcus pneumoniae]